MYEVPSNKRFLPWIAGVVVAAIVWQALLHLASASGAFSFYVAMIIGFNAFAFVSAGVAKPREDEEEEGFFLSPN
jgi:hypothetical protein